MVTSDRTALVLGRLIVARGTQPTGAPFVDGGMVTLTAEDTETGECNERQFGAIVFCARPPASLSIGWQGARTPRPSQWLRRFKSV